MEAYMNGWVSKRRADDLVERLHVVVGSGADQALAKQRAELEAAIEVSLAVAN